jgi:hypothetical protein
MTPLISRTPSETPHSEEPLTVILHGAPSVTFWSISMLVSLLCCVALCCVVLCCVVLRCKKEGSIKIQSRFEMELRKAHVRLDTLSGCAPKGSHMEDEGRGGGGGNEALGIIEHLWRIALMVSPPFPMTRPMNLLGHITMSVNSFFESSTASI